MLDTESLYEFLLKNNKTCLNCFLFLNHRNKLKVVCDPYKYETNTEGEAIYYSVIIYSTVPNNENKIFYLELKFVYLPKVVMKNTIAYFTPDYFLEKDIFYIEFSKTKCEKYDIIMLKSFPLNNLQQPCEFITSYENKSKILTIREVKSGREKLKKVDNIDEVYSSFTSMKKGLLTNLVRHCSY